MPAPWQLPPLILHPFAGGDSTEELMEGSRAALALDGMVVNKTPSAELERKVLQGRYSELRMLLFLGKDLDRWVDQAQDYLARQRGADPAINAQTLARLAVETPPAAVVEKLEKWGVADRKAVFSRAIGIHGMFELPPPMETFSAGFLHHYHRYADHAWMCFQHLKPFYAVDAAQFRFEIFASEEYARMLSAQWEKA